MIRRRYPGGVRLLENGGTWNTLAGQPTDDSEMALSLARLLIEKKTYNQRAAREAYLEWLESGPFDCGFTISRGLSGLLNFESQANGALMRISPLGIFGINYSEDQIAKWAVEDAQITHPNPICTRINALFVLALRQAILTGCEHDDFYAYIVQAAEELKVGSKIQTVISRAECFRPEDYTYQQGWVLIAFQNALWQLLNSANLEEGLIDTVMQGGDTDTNAAICGALLGAVEGRTAIPEQWQTSILNCRPQAGQPEVRKPRPECFWPVDALELAQKLISTTPSIQ